MPQTPARGLEEAIDVEYAVLAALAVTPAALLEIVRRSYLRIVRETDGPGEAAKPAAMPPDDMERRIAPLMAVLVFAFLVVLSAMIPALSVGETESVEQELMAGESLETVVSNLGIQDEVTLELQLHHLEMLFGLWAVFVVEAGLGLVLNRHRWSRSRKMQAVAGALMPPLRLLPGHPAVPTLRYVPFVGWETTEKRVLLRLERAFSGPMMVIALLILPLLAVEYVWKVSISTGGLLYYATDVATRAIWLTFAIEFFVLVAASPKKLAYCKSHWLDLAIILLPLFYFLRCLRILRLGRLANVQKMTRVYRLRGVALRLLRTVAVLKLADRMGSWAARKRLATLQTKLLAMQEEMEDIQCEIARIEAALRTSVPDDEGKCALHEEKLATEPRGEAPVVE